MERFLEHLERCDLCAKVPPAPCAEADRLLREGANELAERMAPMPPEGAKA